MGQDQGRPYDLGLEIGELLGSASDQPRDKRANFLLERYPIQPKIATDIAALIEEQLETTGTVPTHRRVVIERFCDELGDDRICILAPFGTSGECALGDGAGVPALKSAWFSGASFVER